MARAWLEYVDTTTDQIGDQTVTTTVAERRELSHPRPAPPSITEPRRSRVPYYLAYLLNMCTFLVGLALAAYGGVDDSLADTWSPAGFGVMAGAALLGMVVSEWKPEVCTCRNHSEMFEECR